MTWLGHHERGFLITIAAIVGGIWLFVLLGDQAIANGSAGFDRRLLLAFRNPADPADPIGPPVIEEAARDVTALGGITICSLLTLAVAGHLILDGKARMATFVLVAVGSGAVLGNVLKLIFDRPRPNLVPHGMATLGTSFPSGHSLTAAVVYLTLGALLARSATRWRLRAYYLLVAILISIAVGVTRVYLGVHWPTDVLGGWTAGAVWALLCSLVASRLQARRDIERPSEHEDGETAHSPGV